MKIHAKQFPDFMSAEGVLSLNTDAFRELKAITTFDKTKF
jgi:hypothetical protein